MDNETVIKAFEEAVDRLETALSEQTIRIKSCEVRLRLLSFGIASLLINTDNTKDYHLAVILNHLAKQETITGNELVKDFLKNAADNMRDME